MIDFLNAFWDFITYPLDYISMENYLFSMPLVFIIIACVFILLFKILRVGR